MTCIRCKHNTAYKFGTYGKRSPGDAYQFISELANRVQGYFQLTTEANCFLGPYNSGSINSKERALDRPNASAQYFAWITPQIGIRRRNMPSFGTGSDISLPDANLILNKFIKESTRLRLLFIGNVNAFSCGLAGVLRAHSATLLVITPEGVTGPTFFTFNPATASGFKYASGRALPGLPLPVDEKFESDLAFIYPDSSQVHLLEIAE